MEALDLTIKPLYREGQKAETEVEKLKPCVCGCKAWQLKSFSDLKTFKLGCALCERSVTGDSYPDVVHKWNVLIDTLIAERNKLNSERTDA